MASSSSSSSSLVSSCMAMPLGHFRHSHRHLVVFIFLSLFLLFTLGPSTSTVADARPLPQQQQPQLQQQQRTTTSTASSSNNDDHSSSALSPVQKQKEQQATSSALLLQPPPVIAVKSDDLSSKSRITNNVASSSSVKSDIKQVHIPHDHADDHHDGYTVPTGGCTHLPCQQPCTATSPCNIPPPTTTSCTHCGCTGYQGCTTTPPVTTCTHCGCPGYHACTTAPPTCVHCGCPGYQACPTTSCTHCGCPGYKACTSTVPPCTTSVTCTSTTGCHKQTTGGCTQTLPTPTATPCHAQPCTDTNTQQPTTNTGGSGTENAGAGDGGDGGTRPIQTRSECFHGSSSYVTLRDGRKTRMSDVQVGDYVQTSADGTFSRVFMFTHRDATVVSDFVRLTMASGTHVLVTYGHLVEVWRSQSGVMTNGTVVSMEETDKRRRRRRRRRQRRRMVVDAGEVQADTDWVMSTIGNKGLTRVVEATRVRSHGIYNPQTLDGRIVVNGVVMTTYTRATGTDRTGTGHSLLAPLRAMYRIGGVDVSGLFCVLRARWCVCRGML